MNIKTIGAGTLVTVLITFLLYGQYSVRPVAGFSRVQASAPPVMKARVVATPQVPAAVLSQATGSTAGAATCKAALGTDSSSYFSLTDTELDLVTTTGKLYIGDRASSTKVD